ncbi:class D sortase [Paenibacillus bouchesdurhonensis]|uniref:class D sortase n=1 Tax=Paenibacillus bouchesdurhonensis TaxID=1870990 RepID=UPI000DA60982|nr:class D sortase [Paenibacillus bouchesdurhonensis]
MRKLAYVIIVVGICIVLYPKMTVLYSEHKQDRLLQAIENAEVNHIQTTGGKDAGLMSSYAEVSRWLEEMNTEAEQEGVIAESAAMEEEEGIGTIIIDSIDLKLPVLEGASKQNLQHAAAHMTETAPLGKIGNAAIAAHRSRTTGRLFNRLGEVAVGDEIVVRSKGEQFVYSVYQISVVKPTDVSVLEGNDSDRVLTLITCEPLVNPTHRLIVHAKQAEMDDE